MSKTKKITRTRFQDWEDKVILKHLKKYPQNLQLALEYAAEELGRSTSSCGSRYYTKLRGSNRILSVISSGGQATIGNVKTVARSVLDTRLTEQDHLAIVNALVKGMSRESKQAVVRMVLEI